MATVIGVRFREVGRVYHFDPGEAQVKKGDRVIVETARGVECGEVIQENTEIPDEQVTRPLKMMIRVAGPEDLQALENKAQKEAEAFRVCEGKIAQHGLDMKLVNVEYTFDASKIVFHFTADQRVDFRALVRDLAGVFRTRIELRQIGVRDEAKLLGGLGICGRPFCCSLFMGDFHPVSIKMAKEQNLSLNPTKISGTCGRFMCCLKYEEAAYEDALKALPKVGSCVETPEGRGVVTEVNAVSEMIKVRLDRRAEAAPQLFHFDREKGVERKAPNPAASEFGILRGSMGRLGLEDPSMEIEDTIADEADRPSPQQQGNAQQQKPNWRERHTPRNKREQRPQQQGGGHPGKNEPRKQHPQNSQRKPQQQQNAQQQQKNQPPRQNHQPKQQAQPKQQQAQRPAAQDAKNLPRYGEVPRYDDAMAPRRATAQPSNKEQKEGQGRHRKPPWQKHRTNQKQPRGQRPPQEKDG